MAIRNTTQMIGPVPTSSLYFMPNHVCRDVDLGWGWGEEREHSHSKDKTLWKKYHLADTLTQFSTSNSPTNIACVDLVMGCSGVSYGIRNARAGVRIVI